MVYFIAIIAALTGFLFGFDEGIVSGTLGGIKSDFALKDMQVGIMMGLLPFGALLSAIFTGWAADKIGRLRILIAVPVVFFLGTIAICSTRSFEFLCIARFLLGLSIGMSVVISPLYIAETAPKEIRGLLLTFFQLAITLGILCAYVINFANSSLEIPYPWRWVFAIGLVPDSLLFAGALFLPESPRWLCAKGRFTEAKQILSRLSHVQEDSIHVSEKLQEIEHTIGIQKNDHLWKLLISKNIGPILLIGILLFFFQQLSGINVIIYYAPIIFQEMKFKNETVTLLATVGIGLVNVFATFIAMHFVETKGRRSLLIWGYAGTGLTLLFIAGATYLEIPILRWFSTIALLLYIVSFAAAVGPLTWVMIPEIFPMNVRGEGVSVSAASNWIFNTIVVSTFPILIAHYGISFSLGVYALFCFAGLFFVWRYLPETKGLSLEKIEQHINAGKPLRELGPL